MEQQLPHTDTGTPPPPAARDSISDTYLELFQSEYQDGSITKDAIWEYIYGVMHAPDWRERYEHDLQKSLPRIPLATDFWSFCEAGRELMDLHIGYEVCPELPDVVCEVDGQIVTQDGKLTGMLLEEEREPAAEVYKIADRMRWGGGHC